YIPTEDERRVFRECNQESFWYRSVPFSVVSMAVTQALVARGTLSPSPRFGSLPKVVFAGFFGYMAGKLSYMKTCQEKFKRLENSPLGEALRQRTGVAFSASELSDPDVQAFEPMFQPAEASSQKSYFTESPVHTGRSDDYGALGKYQSFTEYLFAAVISYINKMHLNLSFPSAEPYTEEEEPRKKGILYEDLRLKNRENYEVMLSQKAETLHKASPEKETKRPNKEVKNIYGDTWEE
uniref:OCIA domain-containing protein 1 n=1 Tax=Tetraodon nigroviridis TaxID=99883 RepID=H3C3P1_TETNG